MLNILNSQATRAMPAAGLMIALLGGCASVNTTLDRVNQGLAALVDTSAAGATASRSRVAGETPVAGRAIMLSRQRPAALREDSLTTAPSGSHRYTLYEIDTRAWPDGGVLTVDIDLSNSWSGGTSTGSFDLYPEGTAPARQGSATGTVAYAYDIAPGQHVKLTYKFARGQRFLFGAEGGWGSAAGTRNFFVFTARVTPAEAPVWIARTGAEEGAEERSIALWRDARFHTVTAGSMAVTTPLADGGAWGTALAQWVGRAERRDAAACAARSDELTGGPALEDKSGEAVATGGLPTVGVTCGLRRQPGGRVAPQFQLEMGTSDGASYTVPVSGAQLRELAAALRGTAAR